MFSFFQDATREENLSFALIMSDVLGLRTFLVVFPSFVWTGYRIYRGCVRSLRGNSCCILSLISEHPVEAAPLPYDSAALVIAAFRLCARRQNGRWRTCGVGAVAVFHDLWPVLHRNTAQTACCWVGCHR